MRKLSLAMENSIRYKGRKTYFPYLDYDTKNIKAVEKDAVYLMDKFSLGNCVITKTKNGFHGSFFWNNRLNFKKIKEIREASKLADKKFIGLDTNRSRISGKDLKFFKIINSKYHKDNEFGDFLKEHYLRMIGWTQ